MSEEGCLSESHARCVKSWQLCVLFIANVFWGFKIYCLQQVVVTEIPAGVSCYESSLLAYIFLPTMNPCPQPCWQFGFRIYPYPYKHIFIHFIPRKHSELLNILSLHTHNLQIDCVTIIPVAQISMFTYTSLISISSSIPLTHINIHLQ